MPWRLAVLLGALGASLAVASAAQTQDAPAGVRVAKPAFPPPIARLTSSGDLRLRLVSAVPRDPALTTAELETGDLPAEALRRFGGGKAITGFMAQPGTTLVVYGTSLVAGFGPRGGMKYAFDLRSFGFPPRSLVPRAYGPQEIVWARQIGRLLIVQTSHLTYAKDSGNRNGYLTGIDIETGNVRWRSPSLVANARNFVVAQGLIVSGYGFTAEKDWLYLTDAKTGRARDRLALPSMAEHITIKGNRIVVRCYDARVVVTLS